MIFDYVAVDKANMEVRGSIEAGSQTDALHKLGKMGLFPVEVVLQGQRPKRKSGDVARLFSGGRRAPRPRFSAQNLVVFTRQLSVLIDAGIPLVRALDTLQRQARFISTQSMVGEMIAMIQAGSSFSDALSQFPASFSKVYSNLVRAGETGGALDVVLRHLADYQEKNMKLKQKIRAALVYPALVLCVSMGILAFMISFVIPKFADLFSGTGVELPALTRFMVSLSDVVRSHWHIGLLLLFGIVVLWRVLLRNYRFRCARDRLILSLPIMGDFMRKLFAGRFSRTLATLLGGGVPILRSLDLAKEVNDNEIVINLIAAVYENVREGGFIANVLAQNAVFPQLMVDMIAVGEESGALEKMLVKVAQTYEEEVELTANTLAALLEPILVIGMGVVTGLIVLSLFLPMISLIESLS